MEDYQYRAVHENANILYEMMVEASKRGDHLLGEMNILRFPVPDELANERTEERPRFIVNKKEFWKLELPCLRYCHHSICFIHVYDVTRVKDHAPLELFPSTPEDIAPTLQTIESFIDTPLERIDVKVTIDTRFILRRNHATAN
jgi:hypothetical protein